MAVRKISIPKASSISLPEVTLSRSSEATREFGRELAGRLKPGDVVYLIGELGAGKTTLVQGIAEGLGIAGFIRSSSFMLANEYRGSSTKLYHIDLYRLGGSDIEGFGLEEYMFGDGICLIEWADRLGAMPVKPQWIIRIVWQDETTRRIEIKRGKGRRKSK